MSEECIEVDCCHVVDACCHLLPQEGMIVGHQLLEQHVQELNCQVLGEHRLFVQLPSGVNLLQGHQVLFEDSDILHEEALTESSHDGQKLGLVQNLVLLGGRGTGWLGHQGSDGRRPKKVSPVVQ